MRSWAVSIGGSISPAGMERVMSPPGWFKFLLLVFLVSNVQSQTLNTEMPVFNPLDYEVTFLETQPLGIAVVTVSATDPDANGTYNVEYFATGTERALEYFFLDTASGEISAKKPLGGDLSVGNNKYTITVFARDFGTPPLQSLQQATVVIYVIRGPVFQNTPYSGEISDSISPGASVFKVDATVNADKHDVVSYSIVGDKEALRLFTIDQNGYIRTTDKLFASSESSYTIRVKAQDNSLPPWLAYEEVVLTRGR